MNAKVRARLDALKGRAAKRSMTVRKADERGVWELSSPFRVVVIGTLDNVDAWLTAAEERDQRPRVLNPVGAQADC